MLQKPTTTLSESTKPNWWNSVFPSKNSDFNLQKLSPLRCQLGLCPLEKNLNFEQNLPPQMLCVFRFVLLVYNFTYNIFSQHKHFVIIFQTDFFTFANKIFFCFLLLLLLLLLVLVLLFPSTTAVSSLTYFLSTFWTSVMLIFAIIQQTYLH